jgi:copper ion binding protein
MPMGDERQSYTVAGMTCQHCVAAVDAEVGALPGVSSVDVDLASGTLLVNGSEIDRDAVRIAVEEAGYSLTA